MPLERITKKVAPWPQNSRSSSSSRPKSNIDQLYNRSRPASHRRFLSRPRATPADLPRLSLMQPSPELMKQYIREAYYDADLSPGFINDVLASLPYDINEAIPFRSLFNPETEISDDFAPICIEHTPGVTDVMFGALSLDGRKPRWPIDDMLDCSKSLSAQLTYMPWRIWTIGDLESIPGLFRDPTRHRTVLGQNFCTTTFGLKRALDSYHDLDKEGQDDLEGILLGALAARGGVFDTDCSHRKVFYPEHIIPLLNHEHPAYDELYWSHLYARGRIWDFMVQDSGKIDNSLDAI